MEVIDCNRNIQSRLWFKSCRIYILQSLRLNNIEIHRINAICFLVCESRNRQISHNSISKVSPLNDKPISLREQVKVDVYSLNRFARHVLCNHFRSPLV